MQSKSRLFSLKTKVVTPHVGALLGICDDSPMFILISRRKDFVSFAIKLNDSATVFVILKKYSTGVRYIKNSDEKCSFFYNIFRNYFPR